MTSKLADYIAVGKTLTEDEREIAALSLQQTDEARQAEVEAAWRDEIGGRVDDVLSGKVELVDADEHYAQLRAKLAARNT